MPTYNAICWCCRKPIQATTAIDCYYKALRSLQLYITVLNVVNSNVILTMKVAFLGMSITSGYAAVAHFSDQPIFGIMYYVVFFEALFIYAVLYQKAFNVPELISKASIACQLRAQCLGNRAERGYH